MNHYAAAALLTFITSAILTTFVFFKDRRKLVNKVFIQLSLVLTIYGLAFFKTCTAPEETKCLFWGKVTMFTAIWFAVTYLHLSLVTLKEKISSRLLISIYSIAVIYAVVDLPTKLLLRDPRPAHGILLMNRAGLLYIPAVILFLGIVTFTVYRIAKGMKISSPIKRNQLKYFIMAPIIAVIGGSSNFVVAYDITFYPLNPFVGYLAPFFNIIIAYAIIKHKLLDISFVIRKLVAYIWILVIVSFSMAGIYLLPLYVSNKLVLYITVAYVFIILSQKIIPKAEIVINHMLYKNKYNYRDKLKEIASNIPTIYDMERLLKYTLDNTAGALDASPCSIMLMDDVTKIYSVNYSVGLKEDMAKGITLFHDTEIIQKLKWGNRILVREELTEDDPIRERMASIKAEVSIPIARKDKLLGVFNLNHKASGDIYSHEDLSILSDISKYLGMAIENISLGKEKERIAITKNRLDVTTSMAYGVADRIRNYIVPAATYFDLFPDRFEKISGKLTPEEKELVTSIFKSGQESVQKTVKLARETADMCNPQFYKPEKYDPKVIMDLADKLTAELKSDMGNKEIKVTREITGSPPSTYFDKEAIKKVLFHLVQNSIHAISEGKEGIIAIKVTEPVAKSEKEYLRTTVGDTGCGIPKENLDNIFNPFFTTKGTVGGTGLGLTICQFIISQHEGTIGVLNSDLDKGTTMYFDLPIIKEPPKPAVDYKDILGQFPARTNKDILPDEIKDIIDKIKDSPPPPAGCG